MRNPRLSRRLSLALALAMVFALMLPLLAFPAIKADAAAAIKVGSRVWYRGGTYYGDSYGGNGSGSRSAQWADVTYTSSNKYKYHINAWGWTNDVISPEATYVDWNGTTVLKKQTVSDKTPASPPSNPSRTGYTFTGWSSYSATATSDQTITAQYAIKTYTVRFLDWDGTVIASMPSVSHGETVVAPEFTPMREGYAFTGWNRSPDNITANTDITALYDIVGDLVDIATNQYEVRFLDWDETILQIGLVDEGAAAIPPEEPSRPGHIFTGWDADFSFIDGELAITAQYAPEFYRVTFYDGADEETAQVVDTQFVPFGGAATEPLGPTLSGYRFIGWDSGLAEITAERDVHASWLVEARAVAGLSMLYKLPDSASGFTVTAGSLPAGLCISQFSKDYEGAEYDGVAYEVVDYWQIFGSTDEVGDYMLTITNNDNGEAMDMALLVVENTSRSILEAGSEKLDEVSRLKDAYEKFGDAVLSADNDHVFFLAFYIDGVKQKDAADYGDEGAFKAEPGSTKITIYAQTVKDIGYGSHTFCAEFRTPTGEITRSTTQVDIQADVPKNNGGGGVGAGAAPACLIRFETNGGTPISAIYVLSGAKISSALKPPTKEGNAFGGWFKDAALAMPYDMNETVKASFTLYAKWIANQPTPTPAPSKPKAERIANRPVPQSAPQPRQLSASGFVDVYADNWFAPDVDWAYENKLMIGTSGSTFEPHALATKGMVVTVLARLAEADTDEYKSLAIPGVREGRWYTPYAKWAYAEGLLGGLELSFDAEIAREEIGMIIARYLDFIGIDYIVTDEFIVFSDADSINADAMEPLQALFKLGIFKGAGDNAIEPKRAASRAELAALLHRVDAFIKEHAER